MNRYLNAIVVGSEPSIECEEHEPHPLPNKEIDLLDAWSLEELKKDKRVKNHNKTKSLLETQSLFVVPEIQVESIPGALQSDLCHFDIVQKNLRPKVSVKE